MKKIRIVSVGSGWVVSNRHVPALFKNKKFEIVAIAGREEEKLKKLAKIYKIPKFYTGDATKNEEWLNECDALMIGTDPLSHYKLAKFCLEKGKHVLLEKPLTTDIRESEDLIKIAKEKKLKLGIVHNFQFSESSQKLDRDIEMGKIGKIKGIYAFQFGNQSRRLPSWYEKLPWGLFFDESPHLLYLIDKYAKGLTLVNAVKFDSTTGLNTPALVTANFKTKIGMPVSMYLNFEAPLSEWYLLIIGEDRLGIIDIFRDIYFSLPNDNVHKPLDIINTSRHAVLGHLRGTFLSGLRVINKKYLCGNERVVDIFADSILENKSLSTISSEYAIEINKLQFQLINEATVVRT